MCDSPHGGTQRRDSVVLRGAAAALREVAAMVRGRAHGRARVHARARVGGARVLAQVHRAPGGERARRVVVDDRTHRCALNLVNGDLAIRLSET